MVTPLTLYPNQTAASILSTADQLLTGTGGTTSNKNTTFGLGGTGFGHIASRGSSSWAGGGSIGAPNGKGLFLDSVLLDGLQLAAGVWAPTLKMGVDVGSIVCDMYVRAYLYNAGTYTQIGANMLLAAQTLTTTATQFVFSGTSLPAQNVPSGQRLYLDIWLNITTNATSATVAKLWTSTSASQGSADTQFVTPGYQAIPGGGLGPAPLLFVHRRRIVIP